MAEGQGHPPAAAMASYRRSRLPFARPQTLQKTAQLRKQKYPNKPNRRHARTQKPPQGYSQGHSTAAAIASYRRSTSVCQASNPPNPPKVRPTPQAKGTPTSPTGATPARKSHHKATAMAQGHPTAAAMASFRLLFARPQTLQTFQLLQKFAQLRREKVPQQAQHAPRLQAKATTRPQQWLKGTPRPQEWLLIGVQGCRLPGLKRSKPSKSPPSSARKRYPNKPNTRHARSQKPPQGHSNGSRAPPGRSNGFFYAFKAAVCQASNPPNLPTPPKVRPTPRQPTRATPARKSHHKATAMAEGHPPAAAMASYRRSSLPFARPQTLQTLQKSAQLRKQKYPNKPNRPHARGKSHHEATAMAQGHSTAAAIASYRRSTSVCQASNLPNPPKVRPTPQAKGTPTSPTGATPARKSHHKATAMAQGHPTAAAMASFRRSRLPFARPQTLQTFQLLQKFAQLRREKVPQQAQHAPRPHAKATTRPQQWLKGTPRPQEWLLIGVQGCRLPGLKRSKPSKSSKSPPSSAWKRYPNKPNTRHARSQKPPQGHSNGSRAPPGRSNGFFCAFKAAVCQASNPPNLPTPPKVRPTPRQPTRATPARKSHHKATAMAEGHPPAAAMASYRRSSLPFAGCNFSLLEKQTAICLSCCPSPSLSLQYPPCN